MRAPKIFLLCLVFIAGCSTTTGRPGLRGPINPAQATAPQHCPNRFNRARAGGTVGNVVGFVAASALGSPLLGILYSVGGYAVGFASADNCRKDNGTAAAATAQTSNGSGPVVPVKIAEEDLK